MSDFEFGDYGPAQKPKGRKLDRRCNNPECGRRLTEDAPNWFQCSEACRRAVWELNNPPKDD